MGAKVANRNATRSPGMRKAAAAPGGLAGARADAKSMGAGATDSSPRHTPALDAKTIAIVLLVAQTALLVLVGQRVLALEEQLDRVAMARAVAAPQQAATREEPPRPDNQAAAADAFREIVRVEIAPLTAEVARLAEGSAASSRAGAAVAPSPPVSQETTRQLDGIRREIQSYAARGSMSEAELASLERSISELPPSQRSAALSELSRSMTTGGLRARF